MGSYVGLRQPSAAELNFLVAKAKENDPQALRALLQTLFPLVVRYCRARMGGRDFSYLAADDVAQEVSLAVLKALPTYEDRGGSFLYLVRAIASNKVTDAYRKISRDRSEPVAELPELRLTENEPEQHILDLDLGARLARLMSFLPQQHQEILALRVGAGLSAAETAEALGLSAGNVRVMQFRALNRLRSLVESTQPSLIDQT
jgi:RNA polymerase sigma-70 factor (ECF subfamily)